MRACVLAALTTARLLALCAALLLSVAAQAETAAQRNPSTMTIASSAGILVAARVSVPSLPGAPVGVTAAGGNTFNLLSATAAAANPAVTGYNIYRGTSPGGEGSTPAASNVSLPYRDAGLTNGTTYYYQIAAVSSLGTGTKSAEVSATPSTTAFGHYAAFSSGGYIYTAYNAAFNPGSNPFTIEGYLVPSTNTPSTPMFFCCQWSQGRRSSAATLFWLDTTGKLAASWGVSSTTFGNCLSSVTPGFTANVPMWIRVDVAPTTGACVFYTGGNSPPPPLGSGPVWTQLGASQTSGTTGAVQSITTTTFVLGQNYGGGEQFTGNMYQMELLINGIAVTNPIMGTSATTDPVGACTYTTSASGVTYH